MQTAPVAKKSDQLINDCARIGHYFACQQTLNGKRGLLVVFIPDGGPGHYHTQVVLSDGNALGPLSTLAIAGDRWTYLSAPDAKDVRYRTINIFSGRNHIPFETARSTDGKTWTVTMAGHETKQGLTHRVRIGPSGWWEVGPAAASSVTAARGRATPQLDLHARSIASPIATSSNRPGCLQDGIQ